MSFGEWFILFAQLATLGVIRQFTITMANYMTKQPEGLKLAEIKVYLDSSECRQSSANEQRNRVLQIIGEMK